MTQEMSSSEYTLQSIKDFIGDALSNEEITPQELVDAIRGELQELGDYHRVAGAKAQKALNLFESVDFSRAPGLTPGDWADPWDMSKYYNRGDDDIITFS